MAIFPGRTKGQIIGQQPKGDHQGRSLPLHRALIASGLLENSPSHRSLLTHASPAVPESLDKQCPLVAIIIITLFDSAYYHRLS
ncbi:hypothetical protein Thiowin_02252 [Thiorhodovibrio winogradskyi]|uniref:Uncharacterized protein n=1 Tax=Thiorhodovibrio winogradskyi TaxID=77007 RepID=A0ABZ0S8D4_9GAMM|nr:hypothetical protein [Thiorhodovibrio winogradskyi]